MWDEQTSNICVTSVAEEDRWGRENTSIEIDAQYH